MKDIIVTLFAGIAAGAMFSIPLFLFMFFVDGLDVYLRTRNEDKTPAEFQQECSDIIRQKINEYKTESEK